MTDTAVAGRPVREPAQWAAGGLVVMPAMVAAVLCWRRLAGALESPLPAPTLLLIGLLVATAALAVRILWQHVGSPAPRHSPFDVLITWFPLITAVTVGGALSVRGTSPTGLVVLWGGLALGESCALLPPLWCRLFSTLGNLRSAPPRVRIDPPQAPSPHHILSTVAPEHVPAENVTQQLVRSRTADGSEVLRGWLRVDVAPGQRTANVHVAFCPPFSRTPSLDIRQIGGPQGRIKTVQLLPYGARFDLKLARAGEEPLDVLLQFSAEAKPLSPTK